MADEPVQVEPDSVVELDVDGDEVTVVVDGEAVLTGELPVVEQVIVDADLLVNREKQQP